MATVPGARGHANKLPGSGADVEVEDGAAGAAAIADDSGRAEEGKEEVDVVLAGLGVQHALGLGVHEQLHGGHGAGWSHHVGSEAGDLVVDW